MNLTERDRQILEDIARRGALTAEQIREQWFPGRTRQAVYSRLQDLEEAGLVVKQRVLADVPAQYLVTPKAARLLDLESKMAVKHRVAPVDARHTAVVADAISFLEAQGMACTTEAVLRRQAGAAARRGGRGREDIVVPDIVAGGKAYEIELNPKTEARLKKRLRRLSWQYPAVVVYAAPAILERTRRIASDLTNVRVEPLPKELRRYV
jgi:DNA-binding MarR family transcriptional regulator